MKKLNKVIWLILIIFFMGLFKFKDLKKSYLTDNNIIIENRSKYRYLNPLNDYYELFKEYPTELDEIRTLLSESFNDEEIRAFYRLHFLDFHSKENDSVVIYYPIYDDLLKTRKGFVVLSRGIDGKRNNVITDSLFKSSYLKSLELYDKDSYFETGDTITLQNSKKKFDIFNIFFGNKDEIIRYHYND